MSNWLYYRTLTIDRDVIDSSLTDYPVMVKLDDTNFDFSKLRADGYDLIFMDSSETTQLKHEVELFDNLNEKAVYHVKIPSVSDTVDTTFRMYYGDSSVSTDQSDKTNVWDSNFVMVQHMGDSLVDSTGNGNDGTNYGSTVVDGLNGKARYFNGSSYITMPNPTNDKSHTVSMVLKSDFSRDQVFYATSVGIGLTTWENTFVPVTGNGFSKRTSSLSGVISNEYNSINVSYDSSGIPSMRYNNVTPSSYLANSSWNHLGNATIGARYTSVYSYHMIGIVDELRISNIARSDAWIKADDYNLRTYSLLSLGTETANKTIIGIELLQEPTKTEYFLGESLDLTGAILEITYDDLSTQQIEPISASGFDSSVESLSQTVTISLRGFSESFNVVIRNDYTVGQVITIKFTDSIVAESIDGNISAFSVTGQEYQWVDGPDNNGPLVDKEYQVVAVVPHPILGDNHIRIIFDDYSRFPSVVGDITVEYDASLGNLAGSGGAVENFIETFTPIGLVAEPNPGIGETILAYPYEIILGYKEIQYENGYPEETILAYPYAIELSLKHISEINP